MLNQRDFLASSALTPPAMIPVRPNGNRGNRAAKCQYDPESKSRTPEQQSAHKALLGDRGFGSWERVLANAAPGIRAEILRNALLELCPLAAMAGVTNIEIADWATLQGQIHGIGDDDFIQKVIVDSFTVASNQPNRIPRKYESSLGEENGQESNTGRSSTMPSARAHDWDDPDFGILADRRGTLPDFPVDTLSPSWRDWVTNAARGAGATIDHVIVPLLGIASSMIGTARRVQASTSWSEPFTMWTGIVGFSGTSKTPGLDVTKRALSKIERDRSARTDKLRREHDSNTERARASFKNWKTDVAEAVKKGLPAPPMPNDANVPDEFVAPRLYISNATVEKIAVLLQARPRGMLMICDELASLFLNLSRYSGGSDREFWLEAWNGKHYVVERMGRAAVSVDHLLVGITGGLQPDKLARSFQGDADGLYARICFAWPSEPDYQPLSDNIEEVEPEFENTLIRLIDLPAEDNGQLIVSPIDLSAEARIAFEQFRHFAHQEKDALDGREREWWAKSQAHVLRLAGTLAYLDWARRTAGQSFIVQEPNKIEARFVIAAVRLVRDYFWPHSRAALRQIGLSVRHTNARRVLRWIRKNNKTEVSREDIRRDALGQSLDADQTQDLIDRLEGAGWLRLITVKTPGRARHRWAVNPRLFVNGTAASAGSAGSAESS